jgi:hypothetical protein
MIATQVAGKWVHRKDRKIVSLAGTSRGEPKLFANLLPIDVYTFPLGDCTNGGISSSSRKLLLAMNEDTAKAIAELGGGPWFNGEPVVMIVERELAGGTYLHAEPVCRPPKGHVGWMAGGNLVYTSDSRFREMSKYPLSLHDRSETVELYNRLCD